MLPSASSLKAAWRGEGSSGCAASRGVQPSDLGALLHLFTGLGAAPAGAAAVGPADVSRVLYPGVSGSQVPAVTTAAGGDRGSCSAAVAPLLNRASFAAARVLLPDTHSALVPGEEECGGCAGQSPLWVSSCQLLSGTEGFIPFLYFIWKAPLSLWLLLLEYLWG